LAALLAWPAAILLAGVALAQAPDAPIRIMLMADQSGPYMNASGPGGVAAARMASADFGNKVAGRPVEVISGDHQNKADIGLALARRFYTEQHGDVIVDIGNSAISLAVQDLARSMGKVVIHVGSAHADLYGKACSPTGAMWLYDTVTLSRALTRAVTGIGLKDWYFIAADYAAGNMLVADQSRDLVPLGGRVVGVTRQPIGTSDFSAQLLEAQSSAADVVALDLFGADAENVIKQAAEFHLKQRLVGPILDISSVRGIGGAAAGVLTLAEFYWDEDDATRAFSQRFAGVFGGKMPTDMQAADYSAVRHYLQAVAAIGTTEGVAVMKQMKLMPVDDFYARGAHVREDGRLLNDMLLVEIKPPEARRNEWDVFKIISRVPASEAIRPLGEGGCPMVAASR
jgi:branched-chain amino acid transport system substrate-binding protein